MLTSYSTGSIAKCGSSDSNFETVLVTSALDKEMVSESVIQLCVL